MVVPGTDIEITPERLLLLALAAFLVYHFLFSGSVRNRRKKVGDAKARARAQYARSLARIKEEFA